MLVRQGRRWTIAVESASNDDMRVAFFDGKVDLAMITRGIAFPLTGVRTMSEITDVLAQTGGIQSMANELGISESQALTGAAVLLPAILGGFKKQTQSQPAGAGLGALGGLLGQLGGVGLLDDVVAPHPTNVSRGNNVLGQIFGSKEVSREVARNASAKTGLDASLLKRMLPILAMLAAGYMARQRDTGAAAPGSTARGGAGFGSLLDLVGDANPLDDIMRTGGTFPR